MQLIPLLIITSSCFLLTSPKVFDEDSLSLGKLSTDLARDCSIDKDEDDIEHPTHCHEEIVIQISKCDDYLAKRIAKEHGFLYKGPVGSLECYYSLIHKHNDRRRRDAVSGLESDPDVHWFQGQRAKRRVKRDYVDKGLEMEEGSHDIHKRSSKIQLKLPWSDPMYKDQWFLHAGASGGWDMKVREAWKQGVSGVGVSVSILDDGIQWNHPDLNKNYDSLASSDINSKDDDPMPQDNGDNKHGTRCAGEVAAVAGNNWCGVGVAYNAGIGGVRMLDGPVSDRVEAASLSLRQDHIDIYSASWGPEDDGRTFDGPGPLAKKAFSQGIKTGRGGKGNIFIWASGNGGAHRDSCSCDGYTTSIYTLSVSSATFDNRKPWYLEECPSTIATTYSSANSAQPAIVTVDMPNSCTKSHTGTSASAPMAAGIVALALEANRNLTWRDMQHIVLRSANPTPLESNPGWTTNGVGRRISNKFGYGIMDAEALVKLARTWKTVPEQQSCTHEYGMGNPNPRPLNGKFRLNFSMEVTGCPNGQEVNYLEQVQVVLTIKISKRGDLKIGLIAPSGTRSELLPARPNDMNRNGFHKWPFLSVQQWGEDPRGTWTLSIENVGSDRNTGSFHDWSLILYGSKYPAQSGDPVHKGAPFPTSSLSTSHLTSSSETQDSGTQEMSPTSAGPCHPECKGGCSEANSATSCHACKHYSLRLRNRAADKCVSKCVEGQYTDETEKRCKQCLRGCATCGDGDNCVTCQTGYFLVLADLTHFHHRQCLHECPQGFSPDSSDSSKPVCKVSCHDNCMTCKSDGTCRRCKQGFFLTDQGACVLSCPTGTFGNGAEQHCNHCPALCELCSTAVACERCEGGTKWSETDKMCVHKQSSGCSPHPCTRGTFCDSTVDQCLSCHSTCATCNGRKADNCLSCPRGGELDLPKNGKCLRCDDYSFYDPRLEKCVDCDDACAGCNAEGPSHCLRCATGYQSSSGACKRCCAEGEIYSHECVGCDSVSGGRGIGGGVDHLTVIVVGASAGAFLFFILVFTCLMCRDREDHSWAKSGNADIPYKKVPVEYSLEEDEEYLGKEAENGDSGIRSSESEDEDNTLFDTRLTLER